MNNFKNCILASLLNPLKVLPIITCKLINIYAVTHVKWYLPKETHYDVYNVCLGGKDVHGAVVKSRDYVKHAKFVILYDFNKQITRLYTFRVKNTGEMSKEKMIETGYQAPRHDRYFCYFFDEEITLGKFDIESIIETESKKPGYVEGMPIYLTGRVLIKFRK